MTSRKFGKNWPPPPSVTLVRPLSYVSVSQRNYPPPPPFPKILQNTTNLKDKTEDIESNNKNAIIANQNSTWDKNCHQMHHSLSIWLKILILLGYDWKFSFNIEHVPINSLIIKITNCDLSDEINIILLGSYAACSNSHSFPWQWILLLLLLLIDCKINLYSFLIFVLYFVYT